MPDSAKRLVLIIYAVILVVSGACVSVAVAQEEARGAAVIQHGNTSIIFEKAGTSGLPSARYQAFDQFALEHAEIAEVLASNPRLIGNESFVESHPALADFLRAHPDLVTDFAENPGNYVDMPVAVAESIKNNPIELR